MQIPAILEVVKIEKNLEFPISDQRLLVNNCGLIIQNDINDDANIFI